MQVDVTFKMASVCTNRVYDHDCLAERHAKTFFECLDINMP